MAPQEPVFGPPFLEFLAALMRALNTARLYASGHDLFRKNIQSLHEKFLKNLDKREFLFIGCARDAVFLEGNFYEAKDPHFQNFLKFFHALGISHLLLDRRTDMEELSALVGLLAGARPGQGDELLAAIPRENIRHAQIGLLDFSIFTTAQAVASQLAPGTEDEVLWRQLILQPAAATTVHLTPERVKQLTHLSEDMEDLKRLLLQLDSQMQEKQQGISAAQRGAVLGNFIQNLGRTLEGIDPERRRVFAEHIGLILGGLEPRLKSQILGSVPPDAAGGEEAGVIHEIFQAIPDRALIYVLLDALTSEGAGSPCFNNLFRRAVVKYKEPGMLLSLIRQEMNRATQERRPGVLNRWQQLEQILMREQEIKSLNEQYHREIEALATSIQMQKPMVEEEEKKRLVGTLGAEFLGREKARLIIDVVGRPYGMRPKAVLPALVESLSGTLTRLMGERDFQETGILLRELYLALSGSSQDAQVRSSINSLFSTEQVGELLESHLSRCRAYEPKETMTADAICQIFPEKAGSIILDIFLGLKAEDSPQGKWILSTLGGLIPAVTRLLTRRLLDAPENQIPRLLDLAVLSGEKKLGPGVEALLERENHELKLKALLTLAELRAEHSVPRLREILLQKSWIKTRKVRDLQTAAARALSRIGTQEARSALEEAVSGASGDIQDLCRELLKAPGETHGGSIQE
ncbi:MAG: hypothetical protein AB1512_11170 [Thermodesulfobacteriota bacterium]